MRYALVSDLHGNLQAWQAVYRDILSVGVDEIICLGDIVGYGPQPVRVLEAVCARVQHVVLGNHDAAVCGKLKPTRFSRDSRRIIEWTRAQLDAGAQKYLRELPLIVGGKSFVCAHADVAEPAKFRYLHQPQDVRGCWASCPDQLIFIGHTHIPAIHMVGAMGVPHYLPPQELRVNREMRYVINVGSVGQPRDNNPEACYCLCDADKGAVVFRRVRYDVSAYIAELRQLNLPVHPCMMPGEVANPGELIKNMEFRPLDETDLPAGDDAGAPKPGRTAAAAAATARYQRPAGGRPPRPAGGRPHGRSPVPGRPMVRPDKAQGLERARQWEPAGRNLQAGSSLGLAAAMVVGVVALFIILAAMNRPGAPAPRPLAKAPYRYTAVPAAPTRTAAPRPDTKRPTTKRPTTDRTDTDRMDAPRPRPRSNRAPTNDWAQADQWGADQAPKRSADPAPKKRPAAPPPR